MKFNLSTFKPIETIKGNMTLSLTQNGITFSQAAILKLGKPAFVEFLMDEENKVIAVAARDEENANTFPFYSSDKAIVSVRIGNKDLRKQVADLMNWNVDGSNGYRVEGEYDKDNNVLFFELTKAKIISQPKSSVAG